MSALETFLIETVGDNYSLLTNPKDRRMAVVEQLGIKGMSTENVRYVINELVKQYAKTYLEVGSYQGSTVISAALFNPDVRCIAIDNFSEFDEHGVNKSTLLQNIKNAGVSNIELYDNDYEIAIADLFEKEPDLKVDVYFYDGNHTYEHQLNGLNLIKEHLSDKCIVFVDDCNWSHVQKANLDWLSENEGFQIANIFTTGNAPTWWNGLTIMYRGIEFFKKHK